MNFSFGRLIELKITEVIYIYNFSDRQQKRSDYHSLNYHFDNGVVYIVGGTYLSGVHADGYGDITAAQGLYCASDLSGYYQDYTHPDIGARLSVSSTEHRRQSHG